MNREGFSMVELVLALMILMVGVLAMASTTGFVSMQLRAAELRTDRAMAQQQAMERLRTVDFGTLNNVARGSGVTVGSFDVWWDVTELQWALKEVRLYTDGPSYGSRGLQPSVVDTLVVRLARPVR